MVVEEFDKIEEYYQALIDRNSQYVGSFYVGVKTTGIFCIATCRARKPKKEGSQKRKEAYKEGSKQGRKQTKQTIKEANNEVSANATCASTKSILE